MAVIPATKVLSVEIPPVQVPSAAPPPQPAAQRGGKIGKQQPSVGNLLTTDTYGL